MERGWRNNTTYLYTRDESAISGRENTIMVLVVRRVLVTDRHSEYIKRDESRDEGKV